MTDNEIMEALEHCSKCIYGNCPECPMYEVDGCDSELMKRALDLVKRQQAEIDKLHEVIFKKEDLMQMLHAEHQAVYDELVSSERKHGEWIAVPSSDMSTGKAYECSECGKFRFGVRLSPYCQECGAKMDGERKADNGDINTKS